MLITKKVKIKVNCGNIKYITSAGYSVKIKDEIDFYLNKLPKGSHINIDCKCENCGIIKTMWYKRYNQCTLDGNEKYFCNKCKYLKIKETNLLKYGVENVMNIKETVNKMKETNMSIYGHECSLHNSEIKEKTKISFIKNDSINEGKKTRKKTCISKYGVENVMKNKNINKKQRETMMLLYNVENPGENIRLFRDDIVPYEKLSELVKYRRKVQTITNKNKVNLFDNWDGYDYYDKSYIYNNFNILHTDTNYPSIDHKISVYYGFMNNISEEIIGNISNLCITKRGLNSSKNKKTEDEYKK